MTGEFFYPPQSRLCFSTNGIFSSSPSRQDKVPCHCVKTCLLYIRNILWPVIIITTSKKNYWQIHRVRPDFNRFVFLTNNHGINILAFPRILYPSGVETLEAIVPVQLFNIIVFFSERIWVVSNLRFEIEWKTRWQMIALRRISSAVNSFITFVRQASSSDTNK